MSFYFLDKNPPTDITLPLNIMRYTSDHFAGFSHHNHAPIEILVMEQGSMHVSVGTEHYLLSAGDILVINPYELHAGEWSPDTIHNASYLCLTAVLPKLLTFPQSVLSDKLNELMELKSGFRHYIPRNESLYQTLLQLYQAFRLRTPDSECRVLSLLYCIFSLLFADYYQPTNLTNSGRQQHSFLESVSQYVSEHYTEPGLTSAHIAQALYMDQSRFCRLIRQHFGCSFSNHLCSYRILRASELYKGSHLSVAEIASAVGFTDYCYFSRSFKRIIGITPARYFGKWNGSPAQEPLDL